MLLEEFAFDIAHFTELMAILSGARRHGKSSMTSTSINHNWPPVGLVAFMFMLMLPIWEFVSFLSKVSLIRVINYATIRTW